MITWFFRPIMVKGQHSIGYIYYKTYHDPTNYRIMRALRNKGVDVVPLPVEDQVCFDCLKKKTKKCKLVVNNAVFSPIEFESITISKTMEVLGKKVIDSSRSFHHADNRWLFYMHCLKHGIPTPKTYFVPKQRMFSSREIKQALSKHPLVIKAVFSDNGTCVYKANNYTQFLRYRDAIINKNPASPIIAQRFIPNNCRSYRATVIGFKVVQFVEKRSRSWKQSGNMPNERCRSLEISKSLKQLCEKAARAFGMEICGIDLVHNKGKWHVIEANSCPALDFIYADEARLVNTLADYLVSVCRKR